MRKKPHRKPIKPGRHILELVHIDLVSVPATGSHGERYFGHIMCDKSKYGVVRAMKTKKEMFEFFRQFQAQFERPGQRIRRVRLDNGELASLGLFQQYCLDEGIAIEPTIPHNPEQNWSIQNNMVRKSGGGLKALIQSSGIIIKHWPEILKTAQYLTNRSPHRSLRNNRTPYSILNGCSPELEHLRTIGSTTYNLVGKYKKKLEDRATKGLLVGYDGDTNLPYPNARWEDRPW